METFFGSFCAQIQVAQHKE